MISDPTVKTTTLMFSPGELLGVAYRGRTVVEVDKGLQADLLGVKRGWDIYSFILKSLSKSLKTIVAQS